MDVVENPSTISTTQTSPPFFRTKSEPTMYVFAAASVSFGS